MLITIALVVAAMLVAASRASASAPFPITEPFTNSTVSSGWNLGGSAALTAPVDGNGNGWLRLTPATTTKVGYAFYDTAFPSTLGVVAQFDYATWGGTGADGLTFFLYDGSTTAANFHVGEPGGSLGYAGCTTSSPTVPGLSNGYVGVGLDEYGNYANPADCGKTGGPGANPNWIGVRGSAANSYPWLSGAAVTGGLTGNRTNYHHLELVITPAHVLYVYVTPTGGTTQTVVNGYQLPTTGVPSTFKMGFVASTGGSTNYHEIRNLTVTVPTDLKSTVTGPAGNDRSSAITYTATVSNISPNMTTTANVTATAGTASPGLTNVTWTCAATGGATCGAASGTGLPSDSPTLPASSSLTYTITGTPGAADDYSNLTVNATPGSGESDTDLTNNSATAKTDLTPVDDVAPAFSYNSTTATDTSNGTWRGGDLTYALAWQRCTPNLSSCVNIAGATGNTYTPTASDTGSTIRLAVTATNAAGSTTAYSSVFTLPTTSILTQPANPTKSTSASLTFSSPDAAATFQCSLDGGAWTTCTSGQSYSGLAAGSHTFSVRAARGFLVDPSPPSYTWTVKTSTFVSVTAPANNALTNNKKPTVSYSGDPNDTVALYVDGTQVATGSINSGGTGSIALPSALADGAHTLKVTATDSLGNTATSQVSITVDTVTNVSITSPANGALTKNNQPTVSYSGEANDIVALYVDGTQVATGSVGAGGTGSIALTSTLADGAHTLKVTATDAATNTASSQVSITVKTATYVSISSPANNALTNNNKPTVSYSGDPNDSVALYVDGTQVATGSVGAGGTGSIALTSTLADGAHTLKVTATDSLGNTASSQVSITVDTVTSISITAPSAGLTANNLPTVSYTGEANDSVVLYVDGTQVATGSVGAGGTGSIALPSKLSDGAHTLKVTATDAATNTASSQVSITVKTSTFISVTSPANNAVTNNNQPTVTFTGDPNDAVALYVDGAQAASGSINGAGSGSIALPSKLSDGAHTLKVTATDVVANTASSQVSITVDTVTSISITSPANNALTNNDQPAVSYSGEPNDSVVLYVDGMQVASGSINGAGSGSIALPSKLSDGAHTLKVTATDAATNTASSQVSITVDTATNISITAPSAGVTANNQPTVSYSGEANDTVALYVDGTQVASGSINGAGSGSIALPSKLSDGAHTLKVTATDAATNTASSQVSITVDTSTNITITSPPSGPTPNNDPPVRYTGEANDSVVLYVDGTQVATGAIDGTGHGQIVPPFKLSDGPHTLKVLATDAAANTASDQVAVTVKTSTYVALSGPANGTTTNNAEPQILCTGEPGDTLTLYVDGTQVAAGTVDAPGGCQIALPTDLSDGPHTIKVTATDGVGNTASDQTDITVKTSTYVALTGPANGTTTNDPKPPVTCTGEPGDTLTLYVDGAQVATGTIDGQGNCQVALPSNLSDGPHTVKVTAADGVGNSASDQAGITVKTSTYIHLTGPASGPTSNNKPAIACTGEPGDTLTLYVDGTEVATGSVDAQGNCLIALPSDLSDGSHTIEVTAADGTGNRATDHTTIQVVTSTQVILTGPAPGPPSNPQPDITFRGEPGNTWTLVVDGTTIATGTFDQTGQATVPLPDPLSDGQHQVEVDARDALGNTAQDKETIDVQRPAQPAPGPAPQPPATSASAPEAPPVAPAGVNRTDSDLALQCVNGPLALIDVEPDHGRVRLIGAARAPYVGHTVTIVFGAKRIVATTVVQSDGSFLAFAKMPKRSVRLTNAARYAAVVDGFRSLSLKLARRVVVQSLSAAGGMINVSGFVSRPLGRPMAAIAITQRLTCTQNKVIGSVMPNRKGSFSISVPAPAGATATVIRLGTKVPANARNGRLFPTFSLPRVIALSR